MTKLSTLANIFATANVTYYVAVELERMGADGINAKVHANNTRNAFQELICAQNNLAAEAERIALGNFQ